MGWWVSLRVASLTGERLALRYLGQVGAPAPGIMGVTYMIAALLLWGAVFLHGPAHFYWRALGPGTVYAAGFMLYTQSLIRAPTSEVSPWSNATIFILFSTAPPAWGWAWLFLAVFAFGAWLQVGERISPAVWLMLASDVFLAAGRLLDAFQGPALPLPYGASVMTVVLVWVGAVLAVRGEAAQVCRMLVRFPVLSALGAALNAMSYFTVVMLLALLPPALVEATSAAASMLAVIVSIYLFRETAPVRVFMGGFLMTASAILWLGHAW